MTDDIAAVPHAGSRLQRLVQLLETDPDNLILLADAAETAMAEGDPETAAKLLDHYGALAPLPAPQANLAGLAAIGLKRFDEAAQYFGPLVEEGERDKAILFNLAWCRAMQKDFTGALDLLDDEVARALPQAATLQVEILHELGEFDTAIERAREYVVIHPDYAPLMGAVSVLALDVEDETLAAHCASKAPDHPDAMTTLGTLALGDARVEQALELFDNALARNSDLPRAWIGRGLAGLQSGRSDRAAEDIDRGAEMFGDHLGSWIAAGWAYFVRQDLATSRARFEHALSLDDNFAETHGSLAVLDLLEGNVEAARRRTETALRLDRKCYSAALAQTLIAQGAGDAAGARRIFDIAVNTPIDDSGRTIAQALARIGMGSA